MANKESLYFGYLEFSTPSNRDECCVKADDGDHHMREWMSRGELQELADWLRDVWGIVGKEA